MEDCEDLSDDYSDLESVCAKESYSQKIAKNTKAIPSMEKRRRLEQPLERHTGRRWFSKMGISL